MKSDKQFWVEIEVSGNLTFIIEGVDTVEQAQEKAILYSKEITEKPWGCAKSTVRLEYGYDCYEMVDND